MIDLAWGIIKTFGPYLLIAALLGAVYFAGGYAVQRKWDLRESELQATSHTLIETKQKEADDAKATAAIAAQLLNEAYDANNNEVTQLTKSNFDLLAQRVQRDRNANRNKCPVSGNPTATNSVENSATDSGLFLERVGEGLTTRFTYADNTVEDCRAMQGYINSLVVK